MYKDISIKELRTLLAEIADRVQKGERFRVIRRSKPAFKIIPVHIVLPDEGEEGWETVVDFTEGGKTKGAPVEDVLKTLRKMNG
jgi:antitoxin (DNA-binding transcriptional repressor) of toxin-antitoxin stability system